MAELDGQAFVLCVMHRGLIVYDVFCAQNLCRFTPNIRSVARKDKDFDLHEVGAINKKTDSKRGTSSTDPGFIESGRMQEGGRPIM